MKITRFWAMPNRHTFLIKPIAEVLQRYDVGIGWADCFAGYNSPAEYTNDLNPKTPAMCHEDAELFANHFVDGQLTGLLFDPPYSLRQLKECYEAFGQALSQSETQIFPMNVKRAFATKIETGGIVISFGWNSQGFGKSLGFEIVEIILVAHGRSHNDTIVTVERRVKSQLNLTRKPK